MFVVVVGPPVVDEDAPADDTGVAATVDDAADDGAADDEAVHVAEQMLLQQVPLSHKPILLS